MNPVQLPGYTSSGLLPSYSFDLACGEQRLQHTPRLSSSRQPTSVYLKKSGRVTITLDEQEAGIAIPSYGRNALIHGCLALEGRESENVLEVIAYVEGKLESTFSEASSCGGTHRLIKSQYSLWSRASGSHDVCPSEIPFGFILPSFFKHNDETTPLPPSYLHHFFDVPVLFLKVSYQLRFIITRVPYKKLGIWHRKKKVIIPFKYWPRTRPHRPILPNPCFFSSVKTSPEEWYQAVTCLKTKPNFQVDPIQCHLFIPAGRVYSIRDTIPFHVQLSANTCTLLELFSSGPLLNRMTSADTWPKTNPRNFSAPRPLLRVYLIRQVMIDSKSVGSWRNSVMGEGTISPVPPSFSSCSCDSGPGCREGHVDWEGEVSCRDDINVGGFEVMHVNVKDFITLALAPPRDRPSPLLDLSISVPIKLVTDSFSDLTLMDTAAA